MPAAVRQLTINDSDLAEVARQLNRKDWYDGVQELTAESLKWFLANEDNLYVVVSIGERIVGGLHGYLLQHPDGRRIVYIDEVDTINGYRRQGIATLMMEQAFRWSVEREAAEAWVGTENDNEPAKALYHKLGPSEIDDGPIFTYRVKDRH